MAERGVLTRMVDGLANLMTGSGTTIDRRKNNRWLANVLIQHEVESAYRGSWLMRKIIDLPAFDMTKGWRDWQAAADQIEKLEAEEKRLNVRERFRQGLVLGRLGGGMLIIGTGESLADEFNPETVAAGGLQYLYPVSRWHVKIGEVSAEPGPNFGEPETFEVDINGRKVDVHHSRCIIFKGMYAGNLSSLDGNGYWGDSVVSAVQEPVENATTVHNEIAGLVNEAKIDVYRIPQLMQLAGQPEFENRFMRRLELANIGKSNHRALILDKDEEWEQRQLQLGGMAELTMTYMAICAGAADIPATRLLGKSPDGMNATGESDERNYNKMVKTKQENELRPLMERLDEPLMRSALGDRPEEIYWEFAPLGDPDEQEAAEVENKEADTLSKLVTTGLFQEEALEEAYSNRMVESGRWPGYDKAREEALKAAAEEPDDDDVAGVSGGDQPGVQGQGGAGGRVGTGQGGQPASGAVS